MKLQNIQFTLIDSSKISAKKSDYMNDEMLQYFRAQLVKWRSQLMEAVDEAINNMRNNNEVCSDKIDVASQQQISTLQLRTKDRERKLLKKIETTIYLIDEKKYGFCTTCNQKIGVPRLTHRPTATLCFTCKSHDEAIEKMRGL